MTFAAPLLHLGSVIAIVVTLASCHGQSRQVIPWAWERREDLRFLRGEVAYLAKTITLRGAVTEARPRMQPMLIEKSVRAIPVRRGDAEWRFLTSASGKKLRDLRGSA
jgi:hypothetical protein